MATEICLKEVMTTAPVLTEPTRDITSDGQESKGLECSETTISLVAVEVSTTNALPSFESQEVDDTEGQTKASQHVNERGNEHSQPASLSQPDLGLTLTEDDTQHDMAPTRIATVTSQTSHPSTTSEPQAFNSDSSASPPVTATKDEEVTAAVDIPNPAAHPNNDCANPCHQPVSTETAITTVPAVFSIPVTPSQSIAHSDSPPPSTHTGPTSKQDAANRENAPGDIHHTSTSTQAIESASSTATSPVRRSKGARCFPAATGHRGRHAVRLPKRAVDRAPKSLRALQNFRAQRSQQANVPAAEPRRDHESKIPSLPLVFEETGGNEALHSLQAPRAPLGYTPVRPYSRHDRHPIIDMDGIPHEIGALVEATVRTNTLFARQIDQNPLDPYNRLTIQRHFFFPFPAPDMKEYNDEFDRELEALRPVFKGLGEDFVEGCIVDGFAEATQRWVGRLEEHRAALALKYEEFEINKDELEAYNDERQRLITSSFRPRDRIGSTNRNRRLAEIFAAEIPLKKHRDELKAYLEDLVMGGRAKLIKSLGMDFGLCNAIDQMRHRTAQRQEVETKATQLGISGAMLGLQGNPDEHDDRTRANIQQYTGFVVDRQLKSFDMQDKLHVPKSVKQTEPELPVQSHADDVLSKVPAWFPSLDAKRSVRLHGATPLDRFKDLMRLLGDLSNAAREEELTATSRARKRAWNKEYHEPHPGWSSDVRRENGGCADSVTRAKQDANHPEKSRPTYREFLRSGGGVNVSEVMHRRDVNELNYRPSAGRGCQVQNGSAVARQKQGIDSLDSRDTYPRVTSAFLDVVSMARRTPSFHTLPLRMPQQLAPPQLCGMVVRGEMWREKPSPRAAGLLKFSRHRGSSSLLKELVVAGKIKIQQGLFKAVARFWKTRASSKAIKGSDSVAIDTARTQHVEVPAIATDNTQSAEARAVETDQNTEPQQTKTKSSSTIQLQCAIPHGALTQHTPSTLPNAENTTQTCRTPHLQSASPPAPTSHNSLQTENHGLRGSQNCDTSEPSCPREPPKKLRSSLSQPGTRKNKNKRVSFKE
ncbi:hypothetical protein VTJ49DRAFT_333 [Mycothermus thermophilus]|uniref:Uncharacterized protein n=1 Tax=Humicola insolens TaxID=85995 RepID=A0ABR3VFL6_HUMIN